MMKWKQSQTRAAKINGFPPSIRNLIAHRFNYGTTIFLICLLIEVKQINMKLN